MSIRVVPHDPSWSTAFETEAQALHALLPITLHHIGSTAIPGILAKPIIDLLGEVERVKEVDLQTSAIEALGYAAMGEFGLPGRRYFRKVTPDGIRTHHLHIYTKGSSEITRHLAFRDYLRAHPQVAEAYSALKAHLTADHADREGYMDGKDVFVKQVETKALTWEAGGRFL